VAAGERRTSPGDLVNGELHGLERGRRPVTAKAGTAADDYPTVSYIDPPALKTVPDNGLAKTPPMAGTAGICLRARSTIRPCGRWPMRMCRAACATPATSTEHRTTRGKALPRAQGNLQSEPQIPRHEGTCGLCALEGVGNSALFGPGPRTCAGYPASYGHEEQDCEDMGSHWGVKITVKYDWCSARKHLQERRAATVYQKMGDGARATGDDGLSLCDTGGGSGEAGARAVGRQICGRTTRRHSRLLGQRSARREAGADAQYAGPGHWNDPDAGRSQQSHDRR